MMHHFLFFLLLLLRFAKCKSDVFTFPIIKKNSKLEKNSSIIKYISEKWGYDQNGWIKAEEKDILSEKSINIIMQNGKAICKTENTLVKIKTYKHVFLGKFQSDSYYALYFYHRHAPGYIRIVNPLPLKVSKGIVLKVEHMLNKTENKEEDEDEEEEEEIYEEEKENKYNKKQENKNNVENININKKETKKEKDQKEELNIVRGDDENISLQNKSVNEFPGIGSEFEGYLVCEKKGEQALLIHKNVEEPDFLPGPWIVRVNIVMYKNPILPFGRQYAIVVVDNINILKSGKKYFFLTKALESMVDVYYFHLAMKATKKKKFCKLSRSYTTDKIQLRCDVTMKTWNISTVNKILASGFTFMNLANFIDYPFLKLRNLKYKIREEDDGSITYILLDFDENSSAPKNTTKMHSEGTDQDSYVKYVEGWRIKKKLFLIKNGVFLSCWFLMNVFSTIVKYISILKVLKEADRDLQKATTAYAWELVNPPGKQQSDFKN